MKTTSIFNYISFFLLSLVFSLEAFSQRAVDNLGRVPSPQAADLGRFGDIPVSYYTGRANVTIPIQSFTERGVTLNINLSYDTAGPMMNQLPGWVGPGWTLNAGGCITRVQNGANDELTLDESFGNMYHNYFSSYSQLRDYSNSYYQDGLNWPGIASYSNLMQHDYAPDLFYFNFMGRSGHFFLGDDGQWKVSCEDNLVVEFNVNDAGNYCEPVFPLTSGVTDSNEHLSQSQAIKGFVLYDDQGNKYTFGYTSSSIEYSIDLFKITDRDIQSTWVATSWYLTKVEDRFGNELFRLDYTRGKFLVQLYNTTYSETFSVYESTQWNTVACAEHDILSSNLYSGTLNSPCYLSEITTRGGKNIHFYMSSPYAAGTTSRHIYPSAYNSDDTPKLLYTTAFAGIHYPFYYLQCPLPEIKQYWSMSSVEWNDPLSAIELELLNKIVIKNGELPGSISYQLNYDFIGRAHLKEVTFSGNHIQCGKYVLDYYNYSQIPADYLTTQHDPWGYFEPVESTGGNTILLEGGANGVGNLTISGFSPRTSYSFTSAGLLKEITYPTGGKSTIQYEANSYSCRLSFNRQSMIPEMGYAGGARVKSITDNPGSFGTISKTRTYTYTTATGESSGQLFTSPINSWQWTTLTDNNTFMKISVSQSVPILPLSTASGIHVGYSRVVEKMSDGSEREYRYSNFSDVGDEQATASKNIPSTINPFSRFADLSSMRGKILSETTKDSQGMILKRIAYEYRNDSLDYKDCYSYSSNFHVRIPEDNMALLIVIGSVYKLYYFKYDLSRVITSTRYGSEMVTDTVTYAMADSFAIAGRPAYFRVCQSEQTSRGTDYIRKVNTYMSSSTDNYLLPMCSTSVYCGTKFQQANETQYALISGHIQPVHEIVSVNATSPDTLVTYRTYGGTGLPLTFVKKGEYPTSLFWDSADRLRASVTSPNLGIYLQMDTSATSPLNVIKKNGQSIFLYPDVDAATYVYDDHGHLSAMAKGNGVVRYYEYDAMNRLTKISDENGNVLQQFSYLYYTGSNNNFE